MKKPSYDELKAEVQRLQDKNAILRFIINKERMLRNKRGNVGCVPSTVVTKGEQHELNF